MRYSPKPCDKKAMYLTWLLIAAGAVCFCLTPIFPAGRAAFQLCAVALMGCGVFVAVRYCMTDFIYEIIVREDASDSVVIGVDASTAGISAFPSDVLDFTVQKKQGRKAAMMDACLSLHQLRYFAPLPREGGREREPYRRFPEMRVFNYTTSLSPVSQYMAVFVDEAQNAFGLVLEVEGEMAAFLTQTTEENQRARASFSE